MGTNEPISHYLLVFDHESGTLIREESFGADQERALVAYAAAEVEFAGQRRIEVVLVGSDSMETIRRTHANYFDCAVTASAYLTGI